MYLQINDYKNIARNVTQSLEIKEINITCPAYHVATMGRRSYFEGTGFLFTPPAHLILGNYVSVADDTVFIVNADHDCDSVANYPMFRVGEDFHNPFRQDDFVKPRHCQLILGNDVWIGTGATVMGGITVGNGAIIAAGSVITKDVPPYAVVGGNPARILKYRFATDICKKLDTIKWWNWDEDKIRANADLMNRPEDFAARFYEPFTVEDTELRRNLRRLKGAGALFGVLVDEELPQPGIKPAWENALEKFLRYDEKNPGSALVLMTSPNIKQASADFFRKRLAAYDTSRPWYVIELADPLKFDVLAELDYFLVGRDYNNVAWVDYAGQTGTKILFALDQEPFYNLP